MGKASGILKWIAHCAKLLSETNSSWTLPSKLNNFLNISGDVPSCSGQVQGSCKRARSGSDFLVIEGLIMSAILSIDDLPGSCVCSRAAEEACPCRERIRSRSLGTKIESGLNSQRRSLCKGCPLKKRKMLCTNWGSPGRRMPLVSVRLRTIAYRVLSRHDQIVCLILQGDDSSAVSFWQTVQQVTGIEPRAEHRN